MSKNIINPKEDQYGNKKENIFLAVNDNGEILGHAYVYPNINHHQAVDTPYLLFIDINANDRGVKQNLFEKVFKRGKELRDLRPELKSRIYTAFESDEDKLNFYMENGFESQYSVVMELDIPKEVSYVLPENMKAVDFKFDKEDELMKYKEIYDEIFVTPLDVEVYREQENKDKFKNIGFYIDEQLVGGCTLFEDKVFGHIETLFVTEGNRGKGFGKNILMYALDYFKSKDLTKSKLEVWELNRPAVELYKTMGYKITKNNLMFPGINL